MADQRAVSDVVQETLDNLQELLRAEVRLAKAEVRLNVAQSVKSAAWLVAGIIAACSAWMLTLWTAVYALAYAMPLWAATLLVAVILGGVAAGLVAFGWRRLAQLRPLPERAVASVKENLEWLKQSTR